MHVLIAVKGPEPEEFFTRIGALLPGAALGMLVHVIDERPHREIEMVERHSLLHRNLPSERAKRMESAEREAAQRVLDRAQQLLARARFTNAAVEQVIVRGRPEREIVRIADDREADLVVVCGRREKRPGPKSVGKVARFVLDHVTCDVLLVRPST